MDRIFRVTAIAALINGGTLSAQRIAWEVLSDPQPYASGLDAFSAVDGSGNTVIAGTFTGSFAMGGFTLDAFSDEAVFAAKISPAGNVLWARRFVSDESVYPNCFAMDGSGNVILSFEVASIADDFYVQNQQYTIPDFGLRRPLVKLSPNGTVLSLEFKGEYVSMTAFGDDLFAVSASDPVRVTRFNPALGTVWSRPLGNVGLSWPKIAVGGEGRMVVAGVEGFDDSLWVEGFTVPNDPEDMSEAVVLGMDTGTSVLWVRTIGQESLMTYERVFGADIGSDGSVYLALGGDSTFVFAGINHPDTSSVHPETGYLCAFDPAGDDDWSVPVFGEEARFVDVEVGANGDVYAVADLFGSGMLHGVPVTPSTRGIGALRVDGQGNLIWMKPHSHLFSYGVHVPWGIGVAPDGSCRVNGQGRDFQFDCRAFQEAGSSTHFVVRIEDGPILEPEAAFTWSNDGLSVQFSDASQNADEWEWDLGDGETSTEGSPLHVYPANTVYTATLVTRRGDCESEVEQVVDLTTASIAGSGHEAGLLVSSIAGGVLLTSPGSLPRRITVHDACGRLVQYLFLTGTRQLQLRPGAYTFRVVGDGVCPLRAVVGQ